MEQLSPERRGRRIVSRVFLALVGVWTAYTAGQICQQVLFPDVTPSPYADCRAGLGALHGAVLRARASSEGPEDADEALGMYRAALEPEWGRLEGIRETCPGAQERRGLDALERLRYAEEHAVRREAASLAPLRRQVAQAIDGLTRESPESSPPPSRDSSK